MNKAFTIPIKHALIELYSSYLIRLLSLAKQFDFFFNKVFDLVHGKLTPCICAGINMPTVATLVPFSLCEKKKKKTKVDNNNRQFTAFKFQGKSKVSI